MGLPKGWYACILEDVASIIRGITFPASAKEFEKNNDNIACFRTSHIQSKLIWNDMYYVSKNYVKREEQLTQRHDILMSMANSENLVGKVVIKEDDNEAAFGAFLSVIRSNGIDIRFLFYQIKSDLVQKNLRANASQTVNIANISVRNLVKAPLVLPPLNEQKRIAKKLDELLVTVESIKTRLDNVPKIIKRFRQSILTAATSGKLTEEWRIENGISNEWEKIKLEEVSKILDPQPSHRTPKIDLEGVPYISTGDINEDGTIDLKGARHVSYTVLEEHKKRYQLKEGDFIFGKIGTLGKATPLPMKIDYTLSANVILVQPDISKVLAKYLMSFLQSPTTMEEVAKQSKSTSQVAFGIKKMRAFTTTIPTLAEQKEIVSRIESLFTLADTIGEKIEAAKKRVDKLTQSILAKAFKGELVPQDPNDEPAEELLKRIKAEQSKEIPKKTRKKR